jgi:hypothetical protein
MFHHGLPVIKSNHLSGILKRHNARNQRSHPAPYFVYFSLIETIEAPESNMYFL